MCHSKVRVTYEFVGGYEYDESYYVPTHPGFNRITRLFREAVNAMMHHVNTWYDDDIPF